MNTFTETGKGENEHIAPPPANLDMLCSDSSLATPPGYLGCLSACHHGSCCVSLRSANLGGKGVDGTMSIPSVQSCRDSHAEVCSAYEPCLTLWDAGHANPVQMVKDVCTEKLVSTEEGRYQCESLCKARSCCFALDERNCRLDNKVSFDLAMDEKTTIELMMAFCSRREKIDFNDLISVPCLITAELISGFINFMIFKTTELV